MARKKNNALTRDRDEKARVEVRRILEMGPLSLDDAIKREREWRRQKKELSEDPEVAEYVDARFVELANASIDNEEDIEDDGVLRELAADRLERAVPPSPWRDYALSVLRRPAPPSPRTVWRDGIHYRDDTIWFAVRKAQQLGLALTRNRTQRDKGGAHSACSLVAQELLRFGVCLSEDAIEKISRPSLKMREAVRVLLSGNLESEK
jgi:hypothetical protein